jgi:WD40 repeat protein
MVDNTSNVEIWDVDAEEIKTTHEFPYTEPSRSLVWSTDGTEISGVGMRNRRYFLYTADVDSGDIVEEHDVPQNIWPFDLSPLRTLLASVDQDGTARIIELGTGETLVTFQSVGEPVAIKWSPDGETVAILGYRTILELWDISEAL